MDLWQYSNPLSSALLTNSNNHLNGANSMYRSFYPNFDPLVSISEPRPRFYDRAPASINLFDDLDDLSLELSLNDNFPNRYNNQNLTKYNVSNSYLNAKLPSTNQYLLQGDYKNELDHKNPNQNSIKEQIPKRLPDKSTKKVLANFDSNKNNKKSNKNQREQRQKHNQENLQSQSQEKIKPNQQQLQQKQQQSHIQHNPYLASQYMATNAYQPMIQPIPFQPVIFTAPVPPGFKQIPTKVQAHNNQQQRLIQYQNRIVDRPNNFLEIEELKRRQYEREQLIAALNSNRYDYSVNLNKNIVSDKNSNWNVKNDSKFQSSDTRFQSNFKNKQESETSIPSTSADPLNSNSPTPPMTRRRQKNLTDKHSKINTNLLNGKNNNKKSKNTSKSSFIYFLIPEKKVFGFFIS
jgi:hypothetical protein